MDSISNTDHNLHWQRLKSHFCASHCGRCSATCRLRYCRVAHANQRFTACSIDHCNIHFRLICGCNDQTSKGRLQQILFTFPLATQSICNRRHCQSISMSPKNRLSHYHRWNDHWSDFLPWHNCCVCALLVGPLLSRCHARVVWSLETNNPWCRLL